jgi:hypothetical protein
MARNHDNKEQAMSITEIPTSERVTAHEIRWGSFDSAIVFKCADGTFGNSMVGWGYETFAAVEEACKALPIRDEWAGIAAGMKSGAL